jgi:hypothetical protein
LVKTTAAPQRGHLVFRPAFFSAVFNRLPHAQVTLITLNPRR